MRYHSTKEMDPIKLITYGKGKGKVLGFEV